MTDPRVRELAELMVNRCLDVEPGWQVSVRASPLARPLVQEVARAIARRGAYYLPRINWGPERFRADLDWAVEAPLELLGELPPIERHQVDNEDARLTIRAPEDVHAGAELDPERRKLLQQAAEPASRRARSLEVRWALVEYPTEAAAAEAGMSLEEYTEFIYDACLLDWDAEEQRMLRIKERFDRGEARPHRGRGHRPDGRDRGPRGRRVGRLPQHARRRGLLQPGRGQRRGGDHVCRVPCDLPRPRRRRGAARLPRRPHRRGERGRGRGVPEAGTRDRRRREPPRRARARLQPRITRFTRNVLFDEKIDGTVHLAVGASYTYTGGKNESAVHWDMVKDLRPGGELHVDDELVQRDGLWLI